MLFLDNTGIKKSNHGIDKIKLSTHILIKQSQIYSTTIEHSSK